MSNYFPPLIAVKAMLIAVTIWAVLVVACELISESFNHRK